MQEIRANLHGHILAKFDSWWKKKYNCKNLAGTLFDFCAKKGIEIYAISDDKYGNKDGVSRFKQVWQEAVRDPKLKKAKLDENAFAIYDNQNILYCLNGQSTEVKDHGRIYEIVTFGKNTPEFSSFNEMKKYFDSEGLVSILEHPLADGHHGALGENELERLLLENLIDATEFNSKIAVPNFLSYVPVLGGFTKSKNTKAELITKKCEKPFVANDDSDAPLQIGIAYTIFPKAKINFTSSVTITQSLNSLILAKEFDIHEDYEKFIPWMAYAVRAKLKGQ